MIGGQLAKELQCSKTTKSQVCGIRLSSMGFCIQVLAGACFIAAQRIKVAAVEVIVMAVGEK